MTDVGHQRSGLRQFRSQTGSAFEGYFRSLLPPFRSVVVVLRLPFASLRVRRGGPMGPPLHETGQDFVARYWQTRWMVSR